MNGNLFVYFIFGIFLLLAIVFASRLLRLFLFSDAAGLGRDISDDEPRESATALSDAPLPQATDVPYSLDRRPLPTGRDPEDLLPERIGNFQRESIQVPDDLDASSVYANYRNGPSEVFMEMAICGSPKGAQRVLHIAKTEGADVVEAVLASSFGTEPSFQKVKINNPRMARLGQGTGMTWTRGGYFFNAHASDDAGLDEFMESFPY